MPSKASTAPRSNDGETDFGARRVPRAAKAGLVREVFESVAPRYDLMNDLMSMGAHRLWRRALLDWLKPRPDMHLLDLAGGTGDMARRYRAAGGGRVTVLDVNGAMLTVGRRRSERQRSAGKIGWLQGDAEQLPFGKSSFDAVTIAFGIRNCTEIGSVLSEAHRVLRPGGRFLCLEFSRLALPGLARLYDAYSARVIPRLGELVARDREAYVYLVESIRRFPPQQRFADMLEAAGLDHVTWRNLSGGVVAMHSGWRI